MLEVAKAMNIKKGMGIIEHVNQTVKRWNEFAEEIKVEESLKIAIGKTHCIF